MAEAISTATTRITAPLTILAGPTPLVMPTGGCERPNAMRIAAADNEASLTDRDWSPWGRPEKGWETYEPLITQEIGSACGPESPGFAEALARWQVAHKLPGDGVMSAQTFEALRVLWLRRRPFVQAFSAGVCPPDADEAALVATDKAEAYSGKPVQLQAAALSAYRAMLAAAREEVFEVGANRQLLTIFSGYRAPSDDEARCDRDGGCGTLIRARCSAHRTGTAVDLNLGAAPASRPDSTEDFNRRFQSRTPAYRWMVANAGRFGFTPYPFEPWHWEWAG